MWHRGMLPNPFPDLFPDPFPDLSPTPSSRQRFCIPLPTFPPMKKFAHARVLRQLARTLSLACFPLCFACDGTVWNRVSKYACTMNLSPRSHPTWLFLCFTHTRRMFLLRFLDHLHTQTSHNFLSDCAHGIAAGACLCTHVQRMAYTRS